MNKDKKKIKIIIIKMIWGYKEYRTKIIYLKKKE